ncbi:MAG: hypothetical protein P8076_15550 [Gammaproteobacteria bacterium]
MSKYDALRIWLAGISDAEVTVSFSQVEKIIGSGLPASAYKYPAWWSNQTDASTHPQARAWVDAGFAVDKIHQAGSTSWVRFQRNSQERAMRSSAGTEHAAIPTRRCGTPKQLAPKSGQPLSSSAVYLVSCVSSKQPVRAPARELYVSTWFLKARRFVEATGMPWFILSAEHGLLNPEEEVAPYEKTLNAMAVNERRTWARRVIDAMDRRLPHADRVVVLAGARYREFLLGYLKERFRIVEVPLAGLRIGEQLSWFARREKNAPD